MPYIHWESWRAQQAASTLLDTVKSEWLLTRFSQIKKSWRIDGPVPQPAEGGSKSGNLKLVNPDNELLRKYLFKRWPIHLRRTLDQYYYSYLADTKTRDGDQVITRVRDRELERDTESAQDYLKEMEKYEEGEPKSRKSSKGRKKLQGHKKRRNASSPGDTNNDESRRDPNSPVVMVDQLWLWVVSKGNLPLLSLL